MSFIYDDMVYRINRTTGKLEIGLVLENWETNDDDSQTSVNQGEVRVAWYPSGEEETVPERKLRLLDRSFSPDDVVSSAEKRQLGMCKKVKTAVTVQVVGTNKVLENISSNELRPLERYCVGQRVLFDDWLAVVQEIKGEVTIQTALDGSRGTLDANHAADLHDVLCERGKLSEFRALSFYPGQQLWGPTKYFKNVKWTELKEPTKELLKYRGKNLRVQVEEYKTVSLGVRLYSCTKPSSNVQPPSILDCKESPNLKAIDYPNIPSIGTQYLYVVKEGDVFTTLTEWKGLLIDAYDKEMGKLETPLDDSQRTSDNDSSSDEESANTPALEEKKTSADKSLATENNPPHTGLSYITSLGSYAKASKRRIVRSPLSLFKEPALNSTECVVVEVLQTKSEMEVVWQDGTSGWYKPTELSFVEQLDTQEFFPGNYVLPSEGEVSDIYGTIENVNYQDRTAIVHWFKRKTGGDSTVEETKVEELSIYDLKTHPNYDFKIGSCVIYLSNADKEDGLTKCGEVVDLLPNGHLKILLANKEEIFASPYELCLVNEDYDDSSSSEDDETSWETQSEASDLELDSASKKKTIILLPEKAEDIGASITELLKTVMEHLREYLELENPNNKFNEILRPITQQVFKYLNEEGYSKLSSQLVEPALLPTVRHLFLDVFEILNLKKKDSVKIKLSKFFDLIQSLDIDKNSVESQNETHSGDGASHEVETQPTPLASSMDGEKEGQKRIQILDQEPGTHFYLESTIVPTTPNEYYKRIKNEMEILNNTLPDGIYVKSFSNRMDLFSILIKGPKGTPYEDGLFAFDMHLPGNYPHSPPQMHYISYCGERLNPNLYEEGRVCVSLLGTWDGKGSEVWNPAKSNLLQVLVSIQGLILGAEPYYNEAGYDKQLGTQKGKENSRLYNEAAILNLVHSMTNMIRSPPTVFVEEIRSHFLANGPRLIARLESWLLLTSDESPLADALPLPEFNLFPLSKGFCISLKTQLRNFRTALDELQTKGES